MKKNRRIRLLQMIKEHIITNKKEYVLVLLLFIIGIFLGVFFINHMEEAPKTEVTNYMKNFISNMKEVQNLDYMGLLKNSIWQNIVLAIILWFFGTTVIGIPVSFGLVVYRGFCLGYTISVCITIMRITKGILFILILLLLQNILFIPAMLALAVSGFKLYKSIIKDRNKENIKVEVLRHTIFSIIMLIVMLVSSVIEIFASTSILKLFIKYF